MKNIDEFNLIIEDIVNNETVKEMKNYRQHYETNCFDHCKNVAYYSYVVCKKFNLDYKAVARAGMLHDLFLYDWRYNDGTRKNLHAFRHPRIALNNSVKIFDLSKKEQDIILKHMWPLTLIPPRYWESFILSCIDKYCTIKESVEHYRKSLKLQKA